jgi:signal transduction histidine kinase
VPCATLHATFRARRHPTERKLTMLHEFLATNHEELEKRCRAKVAKRPAPQSTTSEPEFGIPLFIGQLITTLRQEQTAMPAGQLAKVPAEIGSTAGKHGNELLLKGFTVDQVIHDYGDLCQAITELAHEKQTPITVDEFHTFNRCLDDAIADAVTEFGRQRDRLICEEGIHTMNERLGFLAHELRNSVHTAMLAFEAIKGGNVALTGATGGVLSRSLIQLRDLVDRSLADVRLTEGLKVQRERISIRELFDEVRTSAAMDAKTREVAFTISPVDEELAVDGDRQMLTSAIANLLQNALKFTRPKGHVSLAARGAADRVVMDIEDECGGLPNGRTEGLFQPFEQRSDDRTGLGLGLSISRRGVEANGGKIDVRNIPGKGCVFTIDLPRREPNLSAAQPPAG